MSHYTVLIVGENPEEQLAPFCEQDEKYMEFIDETDRVKDEYEKETCKEFYCASSSSWGMEIGKEWYDKLKSVKVGEEFEMEIKKENNFGSYYKNNSNYRGYYIYKNKKRCKGSQWFKVVSVLETNHPDPDVCFEGKIKIKKISPPKDIPVKIKYKDFDEYIENWHGYKKVNGKYGYYSNPNAKWDWYDLGGRWAGFFTLKQGRVGIQGHHRAKDFAEITGEEVDDLLPNKVDQAVKGDIDFERMYGENFEEASKNYDEFEKEFKKDPKLKSFNPYFDYGVRNVGDRDDFIPEDRTRYLTRNGGISTFAVLKDGKWYEKGEMGWWGCVSNKKEPEEWSEQFKKLFEEIPDDTLLSVYDCHI